MSAGDVFEQQEYVGGMMVLKGHRACVSVSMFAVDDNINRRNSPIFASFKAVQDADMLPLTGAVSSDEEDEAEDEEEGGREPGNDPMPRRGRLHGHARTHNPPITRCPLSLFIYFCTPRLTVDGVCGCKNTSSMYDVYCNAVVISLTRAHCLAEYRETRRKIKSLLHR